MINELMAKLEKAYPGKYVSLSVTFDSHVDHEGRRKGHHAEYSIYAQDADEIKTFTSVLELLAYVETLDDHEYVDKFMAQFDEIMAGIREGGEHD